MHSLFCLTDMNPHLGVRSKPGLSQPASSVDTTVSPTEPWSEKLEGEIKSLPVNAREKEHTQGQNNDETEMVQDLLGKEAHS